MTAAVVLAGGLGTRLRGVVPDLPKPMAPVGGRPFLEYQLDYWITQGIDHFVLSVGYRFETIRDHFGDRYKNIRLDYAIEENPLGTGGGLLQAAGVLGRDAPFLVLNGDTYFAVDLRRFDRYATDGKAQWCLALYRTPAQARYLGAVLSPQGEITAFDAQNTGQTSLVNGGVYWLNPCALDELPFMAGDCVSLEADFLPHALSCGQRLLGMECGGAFVDIGVPEDYRRASAVLNV